MDLSYVYYLKVNYQDDLFLKRREEHVKFISSPFFQRDTILPG